VWIRDGEFITYLNSSLTNREYLNYSKVQLNSSTNTDGSHSLTSYLHLPPTPEQVLYSCWVNHSSLSQPITVNISSMIITPYSYCIKSDSPVFRCVFNSDVCRQRRVDWHHHLPSSMLPPPQSKREPPAMSTISHGFKSSKQDFTFGPWKVTAAKTHIMKSKDIERLAEEMHMPSLPEMLFGDNVLRIQHTDGFGIEFNAIDALKRVNNAKDMVKVACAQEWQESRADSEHKEVVKRYDWTYTTDYRGSLLGEDLQMKVSPTTERIDMEKLKAREQIMFFEDVLLFEDELHDHGVSMISVKIRVMPTSFFVLLRFFLRVDGVLIRINDTRLYHEATLEINKSPLQCLLKSASPHVLQAEKNYMLREFSTRESKVSALQHVPPAFYTDPNEIAQHLPLKLTECEKLEFPEQEPPAEMATASQ
ncbi:hypothetical protein NFI96_022480, partial [Prochilodus magdalenae]